MEYCYHVTIHKSKLKLFFKNNLYLRRISKLWKDKHFHLIIDSGDPLQNTEGIQLEQTDFSKYNTLEAHFFNSEKEHNLYCTFPFSISSLQSMCIELILKNLNYLHNMEKLNLPKPVLQDIFQQSKSKFRAIEYESLNFTENQKAKIFENLARQDVIFHKQIVIWLQKTVIYNIYNYIEQADIVFFEFVTLDSNSIQLCLKCMKYENKRGNYKRLYSLLKHRWIYRDLTFIQDPSNWCQACQQVALFQILNYDQYKNLYSYCISENRRFTYSVMQTDKTLIKTDYFEKGIKIKSCFVSKNEKQLEE